MEPTAFEYSTKNIPLPSENEYIRSMIVKTEDLCKRMRWKTFFHLNPHITANGMGTYGFKSRRAPLQIADLVNFESDLIKDVTQHQSQKQQKQDSKRPGKGHTLENYNIRQITGRCS